MNLILPKYFTLYIIYKKLPATPRKKQNVATPRFKTTGLDLNLSWRASKKPLKKPCSI